MASMRAAVQDHGFLVTEHGRVTAWEFMALRRVQSPPIAAPIDVNA
jgi:hypothetical protein